MPEVVTTRYTFRDRQSVPSAEVICQRCAAALGVELVVEEIHSVGDHGAPRDYAKISGKGVSIWIFWEAERPEVEVQVDEPITRMLTINAAMSALAGVPQQPDDIWHRRILSRRIGRITNVAAISVCVALAAIII